MDETRFRLLRETGPIFKALPSYRSPRSSAPRHAGHYARTVLTSSDARALHNLGRQGRAMRFPTPAHPNAWAAME